MAHMAHQPDQALTAAIAHVLRQARDGGMSTRDIADHFGVAEATVSRWATGARGVALDKLPEFDQLVGQPRGYTLRVAGYVDDLVDLRAAIFVAPELNERQRQTLVSVYDSIRSAPSATVRDTSAISSQNRAKRASR